MAAFAGENSKTTSSGSSRQSWQKVHREGSMASSEDAGIELARTA